MKYATKVWSRPGKVTLMEANGFDHALHLARSTTHTHSIVLFQYEEGDKGAGTKEEPTCNVGKWFLRAIVS